MKKNLLSENWKKACIEIIRWRQELKRDGEINIWLTTYIFAPLFWIVTFIFVLYWTVKFPDNKTLTM
jgi:hypothetical protein